MSDEEEVWTGSCHCGAVEIRVRGALNAATEILECNCSMCSRKGTLHWIVRKEAFELVRGEQALTCYQFGSRVAKHYFCAVCGCSPYYIARSHPDMIDVNIRCIAGAPAGELQLTRFDGQNWEQSRDQLFPKG